MSPSLAALDASYASKIGTIHGCTVHPLLFDPTILLTGVPTPYLSAARRDGMSASTGTYAAAPTLHRSSRNPLA
jgi:hypothetical protein